MTNRRVVVTGMGITSPLGNDLNSVSANLKGGVSGITAAPQFAEKGFACQIGAFVKDLNMPEVDKGIARAFGEGNLLRFAYHAMHHAVLDSGLGQGDIGAAGIIFGNGGPSTRDQVAGAMKTLEKGRPRVSPFIVLPTMTSGSVAVLATAFKVKRMNFMVGAACATSAIAIGEAAEKILLGKADVMFAGGAESADWELALGFDAMAAMCRDSNADPVHGSRPFDASRSGFVLGEGAAVLVLEERQHALDRGARIYAELTGYGTSSDGHHLTDPDRDGAMRAMMEAIDGFPLDHDGPNHEVGYINTHGTSTVNGDANELSAMAALRDDGYLQSPLFSSTKSMSGHSLGAAGAHEAVYSLLMMRDGFVAPNINVATPDPLLAELGLAGQLVQQTVDKRPDCVLSNSFGFGGVNASLVFQRHE